jgi:hypothetical protein
MSGLVVLNAHKVNKMLSPGYRVDHNPDVAVLRRLDGTVVGYFPIWSMNPERILREAELDLASASRKFVTSPISSAVHRPPFP